MKQHTRASSPVGLGLRHWLMRNAVLIATAALVLMIASALLMGADKDGKPAQKSDPIFVTINGEPSVFWNKLGNQGGINQAASRTSGLDGPQKDVAQPSGVWTQLPPEDFSYNRLNDVDMYGESWAAIVGDGGKIYRTVDGGATWTEESTPVTTNLQAIVTHEVDFQTVVGLTETILFYERPDYEWVQHLPWAPMGRSLYDISYSVAYPGIAAKLAVGESGEVLRNFYNDDQWIRITGGTTETLRGVDWRLWGVDEDDNVSLAVGDNGTIVRSLEQYPSEFLQMNSGVTVNLRDVMIWGPMAIAVGDGGTILRTEDSGLTWVQQTSGTTDNLNGVYMFSDPDAIVVGDNGTILRTRNAGQTWVSEQSNTTENLLGVAFKADFTNGFAVGENGTVLQTRAAINPNLVVSLFTGPSSAQQGEDITDGITLIVTNNGTADTWMTRFALLYFVDGNGIRTQLSDNLWDESGLLLVGQSVPITITDIVIPLDATTGAGYIEAVLDPHDYMPELNENDNTATFSIVIDEADRSYVYYEDFQEGEGGWIPVDLAIPPTSSDWNQTVYNDGSGDRGVMWCGTDDPSYTTPPGYGNHWDQRLSKEVTLPAAPVYIDFEIQYDSEPGYDYTSLDISNDGGDNYVTVWSADGNSGGFVQLQTDLSAYAGQTVTLRWRFTSDGAWSDEDGLWDTNGACRIDWLQVTGLAADDFEVDACGWTPDVPQAYVSPGEYRLEEVPACSETVPCAGQCFAWVAYDPLTGVFPFAYEASVRAPIKIGIESPVIEIPTDGMMYELHFDVHCNLPLDNLVFYQWQVASPAPEYGGVWTSAPAISYFPDTTPGFRTRMVDITSAIQPGASTMKIRLVAYDQAWTWAGVYGSGENHTESPMFDNVAVVAVNSADSGIDVSGYPRPCPGAPPTDTDGDAVLDLVDACPLDNASPFDSDGDGCVDDGAGGRHVEYWDRPAFPITYYINDAGAPEVYDGSDFTAIQSSMIAWTGLPGLETAVVYGGTTPQADADAMDMINLITFNDPDFEFGPGTLGVGITTSFTEPTVLEGVTYRPGQIVDSDIILNRGKKFRTASDGPVDGTYIEAVCTHEAGHLFGISHSAVKSSTMFFVLGAGLSSASLETEDELALLKAYGDNSYMATASRLSGTVTDGLTGAPVPGAAVFAISVANDDTLGNEFTLPSDGSYTFTGLPDGDYYLAIHPLNGSSAIGQLLPGYINDLIGTTAQTVFTPEYWDLAESKNDDPAMRNAVTVTAGGAEAIANFITNVDETGPVVTHTVPDSNITDASIGGSVLISLSEAVNANSLQGNFSLTNVSTGEFVLGNAAFLNDDSVIAFVPTVGMEFSTQYKLRLGTGLQDNFGNGLAEPFVMYFTTEIMPDVALMSLAPSKGVPGTIVSMNGVGFDPVPANNIVSFSGITAVVRSASPTQLVVTVPEGITSGVVNVFNQAQGQMSNDLSFTVLTNEEIPKGFESGVTDLSVTPKALTVIPDGSYAYMATDEGVKAVIVDPSWPDYLTSTSIFISGGLTDIDAAPAGNRVYAVSRVTHKLYRINTTPGAIGILNEKDIGAEPRGILIGPAGKRAFIPTYDGDIQIWDINESSPSFGNQIGRIVSADPNIRGKLASDPAGERLLALTGTGKLLVFDIGTGTLAATISVGPDPRDVIVDPAGHRAYVCDETGYVTIVSLDENMRLQDIKTGGTLRALTITPAGLFVLAVNRELNLIDAIDLRKEASTFRSVAATIPLPVNPVDIELSPDGVYAYTISEAEKRLVVTTVGLGPSLATSSRLAGPVGTGLVLAGSEYATYSVDKVLFNGTAAVPSWVTNTAIFVSVPADATSGPVTVVGTAPGGGAASSNALYFSVLGATVQDALRLAATAPGSPTPEVTNEGSVMAISPLGKFLAIADMDGGVHLFDTDPASKTYHTYIGSALVGEEGDDIVITPDGKYACVVLPGMKTVTALNVNRLSSAFMTAAGTVDFSILAGSNIANAAVNPDRSQLLVSDPGRAQVHLVKLTGEEGHDVLGEEANDLAINASVTLASGNSNGIVMQLAYHPSGAYAYLPVHDSDPAVVLVLDTNPASGTYLTVVSSVQMPGAVPQEMPIALSFTPDGARCLVLTTQSVAAPNRSVVMLDCTNPAAPSVATTLALGGSAAPAPEHIAVSPRGDRAIVNIQGSGLFTVAIQTNPNALTMIQQTGDAADHQTTAGIAYAPDASKFYCLSESGDELLVYDFSTVQTIAVQGGNSQDGVVNEPLPKPLQVVVSGAGGSSVAGVPVTFAVTDGGGYFAETNATTQVVETNSDGIASIKLVLGSAVGAGAHTVTATASGLAGSPLSFTANGLADPTTLPLIATYVVPGNGSENVSIPTAIQIIFSRAVDPASVTESTCFIHEGDLVAVPVVFGFADINRRVSLSPRVALKTNTTYTLEITTGITDAAGAPLAQAVASAFTTQGPPPTVLSSMTPLSGPEGVTVVLSGSGFNANLSMNKVLFNDLAASVKSGGKDYLNVTVPYGAQSGLVRVLNTETADTSNGLTFKVLIPIAATSNEVVATIGTSSATRSVAITPDGARAYAVSPYANVVIPIDLRYYKTLKSIPVGENPVAVAINPEGQYAYIANYVEGTVSIIDVTYGSQDYNHVIDAMSVGVAPSDLAITPDGDRLIVVNSGSSDLSVLDTDMSSATHHSVIATISTGTGSRTVSITPDGGLIYLGTETGYLVMSASSYGVIASIATGSATRSVSITPDGAFLILLTTEGVVTIVDIQPNSSTRDQVIATIGTGSATRTVGISPDGGLLFLVQEDEDIIILVAISVGTSMGVQEDYLNLPSPHFQYTFVDTLVAGEDPAAIACDPSGSGQFIVTNAGDNTISFYGTYAAISGYVTANCPQPGTALLGAKVDAFERGSGDLIQTMVTGQDGSYFGKLREGDYTVTMVVPLGYTIAVEESLVTCVSGDTILLDFDLQCETYVPDARKMSYWKHQLGLVLADEGHPDVDAATLCGYLDQIEVHFNNNRMNPVIVYQPPASGECMDKLQVAKDLLNLDGDEDELAHAKKELMALLFNVASQKLSLSEIISRDGANVSKAITFVDNMIDAGDLQDAQIARKVAQNINKGKMVDAGIIPGDLPDIAYELRAKRFFLAQNYPNPFNPSTTIEYEVPRTMHVRLGIYDVAGRLIRMLVDEQKVSETYREVWDGKDRHGQLVASGVYFYRLQAGERVMTRKMVLLK